MRFGFLPRLQQLDLVRHEPLQVGNDDAGVGEVIARFAKIEREPVLRGDYISGLLPLPLHLVFEGPEA